MRLEPLLQLAPGHGAGRNSIENRHRVVLLLGRVNPPTATVALNELEEAQEAGALVPVRHRMIADQMPSEHRGFLSKLWVRLSAPIAGSGRSESRRGQRHETVEADQRLGRDAEDAFRDREVVGEI
jgi:hypothetical protein